MLPWSCSHLAQTACSSFRSPITSHCEGACVCDINDTKLHSKQHVEGVGADFVFFFHHAEKTNLTITYCHTCKRAGEHDVTFTSNERKMGWRSMEGLKQCLSSSRMQRSQRIDRTLIPTENHFAW